MTIWGHTVNFKTTKQSFKSKKVVWNDPVEWVIFENTQEPIIEESVFLIVQKIRQGRRRPTKMGDMGMFSGLLFCADCRAGRYHQTLYEDNIYGKLSDERFIKLSRDYELEQNNLTNLVEHLRQEVKEQEK